VLHHHDLIDRQLANNATRCGLDVINLIYSAILLRLTLYRWRIRIFVGYDGPSVGPKAKGNGSPDRERDHSCVPQSHGVTDGLAFFSQRSAI
jgi:hypothetical protein